MSIFVRCQRAWVVPTNSLFRASAQASRSFSRYQSKPVARTLVAGGSRTTQYVIPKSSKALIPQSLSYSTVVVQNSGRSRTRRIFSFLFISATSFIVGGYLSLLYAPPILTPLILGTGTSDADSLNYEAPDEFAREVDLRIKNSALARSLRSNPDFVESRPALKLPPQVKQHNLTAGTLAGPGMMVVPPYQFNEKGGKSMVTIFYVGTDLSGHPGIVHGGFLATMLDEGLARCCFPAMANQVGVTANLNINYRNPTMAGQFLVLRAKTIKVEGRKAWAEGWIESLDVPEGEEPKKLVEATALYIEPKYAKLLKSLYRDIT